MNGGTSSLWHFFQHDHVFVNSGKCPSVGRSGLVLTARAQVQFRRVQQLINLIRGKNQKVTKHFISRKKSTTILTMIYFEFIIFFFSNFSSKYKKIPENLSSNRRITIDIHSQSISIFSPFRDCSKILF